MWEYLFWQDEVVSQRMEREEAEEMAALPAEEIAQLTAQGLVLLPVFVSLQLY